MRKFSMIFKTFDSDIDKVSAKWGIFGKSFNDIGTAISSKISTINKNFQATDDLIASIKNSGDGILSRLYPSKTDIQSQLIDVDSVIPKIDENEATNVLNLIKSIENGTYSEAKSFQELYDTGNKTNQWIAKYAQETEGQIRSTEGVIQANKQARATAIAHNQALQQQTLSAKATSAALKALSIAGNMIAMWAFSEAINFVVKSIDDYVHRIDNMKDALEESTSSFEETANEVTDLENELENCKEKIADLQKLADNGTISVADQKELDTLKKTNDELERKLALKKAEQIEEQQNVLDDNKDLLNEKFSSAYKTYHYASGAQQVEAKSSVTIPEELGYALDKFSGLNYALENGTINQKEFDEQTKSVKDDIEEYAKTINESVDAYDKLIDAGVELQGGDLELYNTLKALQDRYLLYNYTLYGTAEAYKALSEEQKKKIIVDKLEQQGLSDVNAEEVYNNMSDDQKDNFYEIGFEFKAPDETDYKTATDYAKAYVDAMFGSAKEEIEKQSNNTNTTITFKTAFNSEDFKDTKEKLLELAKSGELTPYTLSSTKEYNTLLQQSGLTAEQAYKKIMKIAQADMDLTDWHTSLENARKSIISLKEMKQSLNKDGISSVTDDVIANYPELIQYLEDETQLRDGINGLISDYESKANEAYFNLMQDSEVYYSNLKKNEADKLNTTNKTINGIVNANKTLVDQLGGAYNVDLKNFKSIAQAKAQLEQQLIINSAEAWSKYYKVQLDASKNTATVVAGDSSKFKSGGTGGSDSIAAYEEASKAQNAANAAAKAYNEAINSLKKIGTTSISTNITSPSGGSSGSNNPKTLTKFSQTIDWCAETITNLSNKISNLNAKLNNTDALQKQIKYYKQLITAQNGLIKGYEKTGSRYQKVYNNSLKKLSKEDQKKVKNGTYTIEQFSGKAKSGKKSSEEKRYNNIQKAIKARDNVISNSTDLENAKAQSKEYAKALASVRWDKASEQVDKLNSKVGVLDTRMSNVSGYKAKNAVLDDQLKLQKQILTTQQNAVNNTKADANSYYKKISSKYKKNKNKDGTIKTAGVTNKAQLNLIKIYNAYVKQLAEETVALSQAQEDYTAAVNDAAITSAENVKNDYDNRISLLEATESRLNSEIELAEARGQVASANYYKMLTDNSKQIKKQREEEKAQLEIQLATLTPYTDTWYAVKQAIFDVDKAIADQTKNAVENVNKQIEAMKQLTDQVNAYISSATDALSWYDDLIDSEDLYDDNGNLTNKAYASLKLKEGGIEGSKTRQGNYQKDLTQLEMDYASGKLSEEGMTEAQYLTRKLELEESIRNEYKTQTDLRREQNDIIKEGYKAQKEALDKILEKKKKALDLDKSEYDYRKSITEKTKNIADLQKQLAMLQGDTSEEAMAQKQQLKVQLEDAQDDLKDTQYEKYIERYEDAMDSLSDRLDALIEKLDELTPEEIKQVVIANEPNANAGINEISQENDVPITVLGDTGKTVATGSTDNMDETYNKANEKATNAYNSEPTPIATEKLPEENKTTFQQAETNGEIPESIKKLLGDSDTSNSNYVEATGVPLLSKDLANKVKKFINNKDNTEKAKKKKSEYGILNKEIYNITNGRILNKSNRLKLAKMLNVSDANKDGDITGAEAKKVVELLKNAGFSSGGLVRAVKRNGDDGIATLKVGESVLTPVQTTALMELGKNLVPLNNFMDIIQRPNIPNLQRNGDTTSNTIESINLELNLPNVTDKESFMKMFRDESDVRRMIYNGIDSQLNGRNQNKRFGANRL